jgi:hypothetical protein
MLTILYVEVRDEFQGDYCGESELFRTMMLHIHPSI